jgi:hypothetical protein
MGEDVFTMVTGRCMSLKMSYDDLRREILLFSLKVEAILGLTLNRAICVVDEAQHTADMLTNKFKSIDGRTERSVLREQLMTWSYSMPHILVSGTGLSMAKIERILNSTAAKEVRLSYEVFTDTGAFDTLAQQRRYLEPYFPSGYFDNEEGAVLLSRIGYWLHGRYVFDFNFSEQALSMISRHRFTASYVARLIATGFKSPHRALNKFVLDMTKYEPSDAIPHTEKEPPHHPPVYKTEIGLNFDSHKLDQGASWSPCLTIYNNDTNLKQMMDFVV